MCAAVTQDSLQPGYVHLPGLKPASAGQQQRDYIYPHIFNPCQRKDLRSVFSR